MDDHHISYVTKNKFLEKILDLWDKRALIPQFEALETIP
jgi:hypothetical protein